MTRFTVWAPHARDRVELVAGADRHPMTPADGGWWRTDVDLDRSAPHRYALDGAAPVPDPRARALPDGIHGPGVHLDPAELCWTDQDWRGRGLPGSVLYELHVGTFTPGGTLDSAIERLDDLADLGITTVELMPVNAFPGARGWGYDGVGLFAVHQGYGGPAALARFVDAAHARGLAVYLDVVHNHLGPDGNHLGHFGPYFTSHHHTPWGPAVNLDGPHSDEVRAFLVDNVRWWLEDFHLDGLRLDAVHELKDDRAYPILEELAATAEEVGRRRGYPAVLVAEEDRNDPRTTTPRHLGGLGIDGQWADDIHHALHVALTGETDGYYLDFADPCALPTVLEQGFYHDGRYSTFRSRRHGRPVDRATVRGSRFVASLQTHDQVGNRRAGERLCALTSPGRAACGAAILLTSAFTPMLFMGEEWAASTPWQFFTDHADPDLAEAVRTGRALEFAAHGWGADDVPDPQDAATFERSRLRWEERSEPSHARMLAWYRSLIALRAGTPDLRDGDLSRVRTSYDPARGLLVVERGAYRVAVNLASSPAGLDLDGTVDLAWDDATTVRDGVLHLPGESAAIVRLR